MITTFTTATYISLWCQKERVTGCEDRLGDRGMKDIDKSVHVEP